MMDQADPFYGYSFVLVMLVYAALPLFAVWQFVRLRRALHVFQLEGYKRGRFLEWCRAHHERSLFLRPDSTKKPLVMTGRAWRILIAATFLSVAFILLTWGAAHVTGGFPYDFITFAVATTLVFFGTPFVLLVADVVLTPAQALINGRYLAAARTKLAGVEPLVVGVTGSFGKTSTKFAVAGLIGPEDQVLATPGSYNTPLGVCRTINEDLGPEHRFLIVEMGAYREGDIAELCAFVRPRIAALTTIGPAHLERFGSLDAIRRAKYEIVSSLDRDGVAVMNTDDPEVRALADRTTNVRVIRYGLDESGRPDVTARDVAVSSEGTTFTVVAGGDTITATTKLLGRHAIGHVLAGVAVSLAAGGRLQDLAPRIAGLAPVEHRLQLLDGTGGVTVIDDAYNSNPEGADAALELLAALPGGRKVVVTPGMIELGPLQFDANKTFGERAARVADTLIVVAKLNRDAIVTGAATANGTAEVIIVDSLEQASATLAALLRPGDVVLFENDLPDQHEG